MPFFTQHWVGEWGALIPHCCLTVAGLSLLCAAGEHGACGRASALPRGVPASKAHSVALACCPRQFLCPTWLAGVQRALSNYRDAVRYVISMGYVHKVLKLVLEASQWHSCLSHWRRGASWICCRKRKYIFILEGKHEGLDVLSWGVGVKCIKAKWAIVKVIYCMLGRLEWKVMWIKCWQQHRLLFPFCV